MFGFFKKQKSRDVTDQRSALIAKFVKPIAYASALISLADKYPAEIKRRNFSYPIYKCPGVSIVETWNYMTIEACLNTVRFGHSGIIDLADVTMQDEILHCFLIEKTHLQYPQPSGSKASNAIQGMWQAYIYLSEAGTSVCDCLTDKYILSSRGESIITDIEAEATKLSKLMGVKNREKPSELPETLFEAFYKDLKIKTKSIALSRFYGPCITEGMEDFEQKIEAESGRELSQKQAQVHKILLTANTPDDASELIHAIFNS